VASISGPQADDFLLKVQKAAAGPPWLMESPPVVQLRILLRDTIRKFDVNRKADCDKLI